MNYLVRRTSWILTLGIALQLGAPGLAQVDTAWVRMYNGPANGADVGQSIDIGPALSVYATGYSVGAGTGTDGVTAKYDSSGNAVLIRRYDGPENYDEKMWAIKVHDDGSAYVVGESDSDSTSYDYIILKYDPSGTLLWERRYNGPGNHNDKAYSLQLDAAGCSYITGESEGVLSEKDVATLKYDASGNLTWVRRYDGPESGMDVARDLDLDSNANVYVTGYTQDDVTGSEYVTLKYDSAGVLLWERRYKGPGSDWNTPTDIHVLPSGSVYVTGQSDRQPGDLTNIDYATVAYDGDGNLLWDRQYDGPSSADDVASAVAVDRAGCVYVGGKSWGGEGWEYTLVKYDFNGNFLWEYRNSDWGDITDLAIDTSCNIYSTGSGNTTVKLDSSGDVQWVRSFGPGLASAIVLDDDGGIYTTGSSFPTDLLTIKYIPVCHCNNQGDAEPDGFITSLDLAAVIDALFASGANPQDPDCPTYRFDLDCDFFTTALDLSIIIDHLFVSGPGPCEPCPQ